MSTRRRIMQTAVPTVKRHRDRLDDPEIRNGRRLVRDLRKAPPDVVVFGDSLWKFVASYDEDQRRLAPLVEEHLAPGVTLGAYVGAGYNALLMRSYVHLLREHDARPVVIVPLTTRLVASAWRHHPKYNYERVSRMLLDVDGSTPLRRIQARSADVSGQFAAYERRPIDTWAGSMTIRDLRRRILDPAAFDLDAESARRMLYAYHYGEEVRESDHPIGEVEALGRALAEASVTVVAYETSVPVVEGTALWGEQFRERASATLALMGDALRRGMGTDVPIIKSGLVFETSAFIDPADGSEHLNQLGRHRYAELLAGAVNEVVAVRSRR